MRKELIASEYFEEFLKWFDESIAGPDRSPFWKPSRAIRPYDLQIMANIAFEAGFKAGSKVK